MRQKGQAEATSVELQRRVEMLQRRLLLAEGVSGARPPRPPRPPDASLPVRPEGAPETPGIRPLIGDAAAYEAVEYHAVDVPVYRTAEYEAADVLVLDPDDE